ncbi:unnamed protein product, partial [Prorocentrum cordatum]
MVPGFCLRVCMTLLYSPSEIRLQGGRARPGSTPRPLAPRLLSLRGHPGPRPAFLQGGRASRVRRAVRAAAMPLSRAAASSAAPLAARAAAGTPRSRRKGGRAALVRSGRG